MSSIKVLVTAGPTWIKVDEVRILTSVFTGNTGLYLAKEMKKKGFDVTLIMNTHCAQDTGDLRVVPFRYFEEFKACLKKELRSRCYDAIVHSAAVSDYTVRSVYQGKIPSGRKQLDLSLRPTEKLVKMIRRLAPRAVLIQFKLEMKRKGLLPDAYRSLKDNKSDFVVANAFENLKTGYKAFLIDTQNNTVKISSRRQLAHRLCRAITSVCR